MKGRLQQLALEPKANRSREERKEKKADLIQLESIKSKIEERSFLPGNLFTEPVWNHESEGRGAHLLLSLINRFFLILSTFFIF